MSELMERYSELMDIYNELKREVRQRNPLLYERWKAGGFLVDSDIMSMYPDLEKVIESLDEEDEENDDEEEGEE